MKKLLLAILGIIGMRNTNAGLPLDFSAIDSCEKVLKLAQEGKLFKILLFPAEFGGEDVPQNVVYVPVGIPDIKDKVIGTLIRLGQEGLIDNLQVSPDYKGNSFVPSRINMKTSRSGKSGEFNPTIEIW